MAGRDGPQRKGDEWRLNPQLVLKLILPPSHLLPAPAPHQAPAHRAQRGVCVPPANHHLEEKPMIVNDNVSSVMKIQIN